MKITYLQCGKHNKKLFSWYRHDFQVFQPSEGQYYMIDGAASLEEDYYQYSGELEKAEVKDIIQDVRNSFLWGKNTDKNGNPLYKTKEETIEWSKSKEGKDYKKLYLLEWKLYNKGINLLRKPTEFILLKDLDSSHICNIISYLNQKTYNKILQNEIQDDALDVQYSVMSKKDCIIIEIMSRELEYRTLIE